jgi:hypothetical protein
MVVLVPGATGFGEALADDENVGGATGVAASSAELDPCRPRSATLPSQSITLFVIPAGSMM